MTLEHYDETGDIADFMSPYVEFLTAESPSGEWIPATEEEAQSQFLEFVDRIQAAAWDKCLNTVADKLGYEEFSRQVMNNPYIRTGGVK